MSEERYGVWFEDPRKADGGWVVYPGRDTPQVGPRFFAEELQAACNGYKYTYTVKRYTETPKPVMDAQWPEVDETSTEPEPKRAAPDAWFSYATSSVNVTLASSPTVSRYAVCARCKQHTFDLLSDRCIFGDCEERATMIDAPLLTRLLAETDPALVAIVDARSEGDASRRERNIGIAVARDEAGARTRAEETVRRIQARIAGKP